MLHIDDKIITASILDIVQLLKSQLYARGIIRFNDIKIGSEDLIVTCPIHKEGQEHKPSCGISLYEKNNFPEGTVHCFTCGYVAKFEEMISHCFGYDDNGAYGKRWLISNFLAIDVEMRKPFLDFDNLKQKVSKQTDFVSEDELKQYRYYHDYMFKRKMTKEIIIKFDLGYDVERDCITFPVCDEKGNCLFIARRSVKGKYFNYPTGVDKPLYGLHLVPKDCKSVIICESIFNALTCWVYGKPAIALLGTGSDSQIQKLKKLNFRHFTLALDPDSAGDKGTNRIVKKLTNKLISRLIIPEGKDINDLTKEEFDNLEEVNC